jgi:tetratricopeptide (TPR) repeat protein
MSPRPVEIPTPQFQQAIRSARAGRFGEAVQAIERELSRQKERESCAAAAANALAETARLAETGGDLATSDRALELALELRPRYADLHYQRACVLLARQRRAEARRCLDAAIGLNPHYLAARLEHAMLDAREGLIGEALDSLRTLARDLPVEDPRAFQQGLKSLERADWDEADALLRRALSLSNPDLKEQLERLRAHLDQGEAGRAAQFLREILPGREAYPDLHQLLGMAELALGHVDDALVALARALELNPDFHDARVQFARALECAGASAPAEAQLALVLRCDPAHRGALELKETWARRARRDPEPAADRQVSYKSSSK